jgi:hypothetical protein
MEAKVIMVLGLALMAVTAEKPRCNGQNDGCCTVENPCDVGDGDCDSDDECKGDNTRYKDNLSRSRAIKLPKKKH